MYNALAVEIRDGADIVTLVELIKSCLPTKENKAEHIVYYRNTQISSLRKPDKNKTISPDIASEYERLCAILDSRESKTPPAINTWNRIWHQWCTSIIKFARRSWPTA